MTKKSYSDLSWENNSYKYPIKRGVCDHCGQRDDLKLAFDLRRYICLNASACLLRWKKGMDENGEN